MILRFFDSLFGSVENFGFLIGVLDGSSVDFQWAEGRHNMWNVILRFAHHPNVGSENYNNLYRNLLMGNVSWAVVCL